MQSPFQVGDKGKALFWTKTRQPNLPGIYLNPGSSSKNEFWAQYLDFAYKHRFEMNDHIQFSNDSSQREYAWDSFIMIDSDIYFDMSDASINNFVVCKKCTDPDTCAQCKALRKEKISEYQSKDPAQQIKYLETLLAEYQYVPSKSELTQIVKLAIDARDQIKTYCEVFKDPFDGSLTQKKSQDTSMSHDTEDDAQDDVVFEDDEDDEDEDQLYKFIILCRDNAQRKKHTERSADGKNSETITRWRYGFHIYFPNLICDKTTKDFLAKSIKLAHLDSAKMIWPYTSKEELFDAQPLKGSTALPLIAPPQKQYSRYVEVHAQSDKTKVLFKSVFENDRYSKDVLEELNPFVGTQICLKQKWRQYKYSNMNLISFFQKMGYTSYKKALSEVINHAITRKIFSQNPDLKHMCFNFNHPDWDQRVKIAIYLCGYLSSIHPTSTAEEIKLMASILMFIIMAHQEDLDVALNGNKIVQQIEYGWLTKDSGRYPQKVMSYVDTAYAKQLTQTQKELSYNKLVETFNTYIKQNGNPELALNLVNARQQQVYDIFKQYIEQIDDGMYRGSFLWYNILDPAQTEIIKDHVIYKYIYNILSKDIYVDDSNDLFCFETNQKGKDTNKYHLMSDDRLEPKFLAINEMLFNGITNRRRQLQRENEHKIIELGQDEDGDQITYMMGLVLKKKEFYRDEQFFQFVQEFQGLIKLQSVLMSLKKDLNKPSFRKIIKQDKIMGGDNVVNMDQAVDVFGVYNGLIKYNAARVNFQFLSTGSKDAFISRSTLFAIRPEFLDKDGYLLPKEKLPAPLLQVYEEIENTAKTIYGRGDDMIVLKWKIYQIVHRMLKKTIPGDYLFIAYGTGGDGKTTIMQAICNALGITGFSKTYNREARSICTAGYTSIAKSTILQTNVKGANEADTGGTIELKDNFYQLCSELQQSVPLASAMIKTLLGGTAISGRKIFKESKSFMNMCFIELQTNFYPTFDKTLDTGITRRILFYKHKVKFIAADKYYALPEDRRQDYEIADPQIQQRLFNDWDYVDVLGLFMLHCYMDCIENDNVNIPQVLVQERDRFFETQCQYLATCLQLLQKAEPNAPADESFVIYSVLKEKVRELMSLKRVRVGEQGRETENHMFKLRQIYQTSIRAYNLETQEEEIVSENNFQEKEQSPKYVVIIKDLAFKGKEDKKDNSTKWFEMMQ